MKTLLYEKHLGLGAKITSFAGWEMPVQYQGVIQEHQAVRKRVGLFDVSHMGRIVIEGPQAESFLDTLTTNRITGKSDFSAIYTVLPHKEGGSVDDVIVYRYNAEKFFIVVNAGNRDKDWQHLNSEADSFNIKLHSHYNDEGILAIQGPKALNVIEKLFPSIVTLKTMEFTEINYQGKIFPLAKTGYTGSGGYEMYCPLTILENLWDDILLAGKSEGIEPIGLAARDTLRLEMGYALYGHELSDTISAIESVASWTVKMDKPNFLGKAAMKTLQQLDKARHQYGVILQEKGVPREGYEVYNSLGPIGIVTSGTFSPSLEKGIALIMVHNRLKIGDTVEVLIRKNRVRAEVVPLPFYKSEKVK